MPYCPECNTYAYDETSFFCYRCGAQLQVQISEKERSLEKKKESQNNITTSPKKESTLIKADSLKLPKSAVTQQIHPVEICAQCGRPIDDKNRIFCRDCDSDNREALSEEMSLVMKNSFPEPLLKSISSSQNPSLEMYKEESLPVERTSSREESSLSYQLANSWKDRFMLAGIVLLFFIIMLIMLALLLIFPEPAI